PSAMRLASTSVEWPWETKISDTAVRPPTRIGTLATGPWTEQGDACRSAGHTAASGPNSASPPTLALPGGAGPSWNAFQFWTGLRAPVAPQIGNNNDAEESLGHDQAGGIFTAGTAGGRRRGDRGRDRPCRSHGP